MLKLMQFSLLFVIIVNEILANASQPIVIAHRGFPRYFPEHGSQGMEKVVELPIDYLELDLVLSKDNKLIVNHDLFLERTTNVADVFPHKKRSDGHYYVIDFTLKELKKLQLHQDSNRVNKGKRPDKVMEIAEVMDKVKNKSALGLYIELKDPEFHHGQNKDFERILLLFLHHHLRAGRKIILQSFSQKSLKRIKEELKAPYPLVQLIGKNNIDLLDSNNLRNLKNYAFGIGVSIDHVYNAKNFNKNFVKQAKDNALAIHVYTVRNDRLPGYFKSEFETLNYLFKDQKVDGVFTDNADTTLENLKKL